MSGGSTGAQKLTVQKQNSLNREAKTEVSPLMIDSTLSIKLASSNNINANDGLSMRHNSSGVGGSGLGGGGTSLLRPLPPPLPINTQMRLMVNTVSAVTGGRRKSGNEALAIALGTSLTGNNAPQYSGNNGNVGQQNASNNAFVSRQQQQILQRSQSKSSLANINNSNSPQKQGDNSKFQQLSGKKNAQDNSPMFLLNTSPSKLFVKETKLANTSNRNNLLKKDTSTSEFTYSQDNRQQQQAVPPYFSLTSTLEQTTIQEQKTVSKPSIYQKPPLIVESKQPSEPVSMTQSIVFQHPHFFQVLPSKRNTQITPLNEFSRTQEGIGLDHKHGIDSTYSLHTAPLCNHHQSQSVLNNTEQQQQQQPPSLSKRRTFIGGSVNNNIIVSDATTTAAAAGGRPLIQKKAFVIKSSQDQRHPQQNFVTDNSYVNGHWSLQSSQTQQSQQQKMAVNKSSLSATNRLVTIKNNQLVKSMLRQQPSYSNNNASGTTREATMASPQPSIHNRLETNSLHQQYLMSIQPAVRLKQATNKNDTSNQLSSMSLDDNLNNKGTFNLENNNQVQGQGQGQRNTPKSSFQLQQNNNYNQKFLSGDKLVKNNLLLNSATSSLFPLSNQQQQDYSVEDFTQREGGIILSSTLKSSILQAKDSVQSTAEKKKKDNKTLTSPLNLIPNNEAVYKQTQIYRQLQQQQQLQMSMGRPGNKNKRIVLAAGSSHFRHSSNTVKKQLLQQAAGATSSNIQSANKSNNHYKKDDAITALPFNYKLIPSISYETSNRIMAEGGSSSTTPQKYGNQSQSNGQNVSSSVAMGGKKFGLINNNAAKGIDDFSKELQNIIEKEKVLTDEIIRNSLVKPNGRFNFEAMAHLNDIMESKKNIKKRFGVDGLNINNLIKQLQKQAQQDPIIMIKSYSEQSKDPRDDQEQPGDLSQPNEAQLQQLVSAATGMLSIEEQQRFFQTYSGSVKVNKPRISDNFLKNHYGLQKQQNEGLMSPKAGDSGNDQVFNKNESQSSIKQQQSKVIGSSLSGNSPPLGKRLKKKPRIGTSQDKNRCKIKIFHKEDASLRHIQEHPINKAIQKINYLIRLIFKNMNVVNPAKQEQQPADPKNQGILQIKLANGDIIPPQMIHYSTSDVAQQQQQLAQQTVLQQHQQEEQRLNEIQRVAFKWFGIQIPLKRLESRAAHREYFQSRDFLHLLKTKFNSLLFGTINRLNKMSDLIDLMQKQQALQGIQFQRFYVGWGNNDAIVKQVLKTRPWWQQGTAEEFSEVQFMWTSWKKQNHIDYLSGGNLFSTQVGGQIMNQSLSFATDDDCIVVLQNVRQSCDKKLKNQVDRGSFKLYNRMEQNKQLTNKKGVFLNMREYYYLTGVDPFDVLPFTFLIKPSKNGELDFQRFQTHYNDIALQAKDNAKNRQFEIEKRVREIRNEFALKRRREEKERFLLSGGAGTLERKKGIKGSKSGINRQGSKMQCYEEQNVQDELSDVEEDSRKVEEEQRAIENDQKIKDIKMKYTEIRNIWIVKPGENTNRGTGIEVCSDLNEIRKLVMNTPGSSGQESTFIIQRYIDNPLLIHGRKFDFRCYGIMTSINGHLKGYFYEDAYIRTSCKEFDIDDVHNKYIHLTNDAVQKFSQDYGKYENGNKLSMSDFQRYLKTYHPQLNVDVWKHIMPQIRKLVTDSYRSVYGKIDPARLHNTFELFGYDFMLDADFRLYLIEVNTNPCLETSCPLLARIIPEVLENTFRLVLDPMFPCPDSYNPRKTQQQPLEVKFTLVFDEDVDGQDLLKLRHATGGIGSGGGQGSDEIESDDEDEQQKEEGLIRIENQNQEIRGEEKVSSQQSTSGASGQ